MACQPARDYCPCWQIQHYIGKEVCGVNHGEFLNTRCNQKQPHSSHCPPPRGIKRMHVVAGTVAHCPLAKPAQKKNFQNVMLHTSPKSTSTCGIHLPCARPRDVASVAQRRHCDCWRYSPQQSPQCQPEVLVKGLPVTQTGQELRFRVANGGWFDSPFRTTTVMRLLNQ